MNITQVQNVNGRLDLQVIRKGKVVQEVLQTPNLLLNTAFHAAGHFNPTGNPQVYIMPGAVPNTKYDDVVGTWNQTGNTVTRATGAGTFLSNTWVGAELKWQDGERCHYVTRVSDTSFTVSGPARTITGKTIRRYMTTNNFWSYTGYKAQPVLTNTGNVTTITTDGIVVARTFECTSNSMTENFQLNYLLVTNGAVCAVIVLPAEISILVDDQIKLAYTVTTTTSNRVQNYSLGAESTRVPTKYSCTAIAGTGTYFDVTFSAAHHFLAGDVIDLTAITPKKFAISSASSDSTKLTINTSSAHGRSPGDTIVVEGCSVAGYNGTWTAATASGTVITVTNGSNPGAMGASGTVRLATPSPYFNIMATVASVPNSTTVRVTSTTTGAAIEPITVGGNPAVTVLYPVSATAGALGNNHTDGSGNGGYVAYYYSEANAKATPATNVVAASPSSTNGVASSTMTSVSATYTNDFTCTKGAVWNAGVGQTRIKQIIFHPLYNSQWFFASFATPFVKGTADRLTVNFSTQTLRELE